MVYRCLACLFLTSFLIVNICWWKYSSAKVTKACIGLFSQSHQDVFLYLVCSQLKIPSIFSLIRTVVNPNFPYTILGKFKSYIWMNFLFIQFELNCWDPRHKWISYSFPCFFPWPWEMTLDTYGKIKGKVWAQQKELTMGCRSWRLYEDL